MGSEIKYDIALLNANTLDNLDSIEYVLRNAPSTVTSTVTVTTPWTDVSSTNWGAGFNLVSNKATLGFQSAGQTTWHAIQQSANLLTIWSRGTAGGSSWQRLVDFGSGTVNFSVTPTISGVALSTSAHNHDSSYVQLVAPIKSDLTTTTNSGFYQTMSASLANAWPEASAQPYALISALNTLSAGHYALQIAGNTAVNGKVFVRNTNNAGSTGWLKLWNEGNDGAGSGLDADLLDGQHGSYYAVATHTHAFTGDVTGSGSSSIAMTLANSGVTAGTYRSVTVDAKGRVTAGTNPTTLAGYGITDASSSSHSHSQIYYNDTRSTDFVPNVYTGITYHLKTNTTDSLVDGGTYHGLLNLVQWSDISGGLYHQVGFTDNTNIWHRSHNGTSFGTWRKVWDSANLTNLNQPVNAQDIDFRVLFLVTKTFPCLEMFLDREPLLLVSH